MQRISFFLLAVWWNFVNAIVWDSPKATSTPTSLITSTVAPETSALATLLKRDTVGMETCGYVGADQTRPATCSASSSCVWHTDLRVVGCCGERKRNSACLFYTSCRDAGSDTTFADDPLVYTCTGTQLCFNNVYDNGYFQVGCGGTQAIVRTTYQGQPPEAPTVQVTYTGAKELDAPPSTVTTTSTVIGMPRTTATLTATSTADAQSSQHGIGGGVAAGIAIGCLALGAIAATFLTFCFLRQKQNKNAAAGGNQQSPQSIGYVYHERHPSMTTYASPNPQFSAPVSPNMYSARLAPPEASINQPYNVLSPGIGGMQPSEMEAPPNEMDASPTPNVVPVVLKKEVKNIETSNAA